VQDGLELGYIGIEVPEPGSLTSFFGEVIGLVPGEPATSGTMTWRNDGKAHRVILQPGPTSDAAFIGFEAANANTLAGIVERLGANGSEVTHCNTADRQERRVEDLFRIRAPWGVTVELVHGLQAASTPYDSPVVPGGFLTRDVGFGHAVFATTAFEESCTFLVDGLGMEQSDWMETEIAPGIELEVRFFHCNPRHHTIALAKAPFDLPQTLHHVMFETNDRDDVGTVFDRAWATDLPIPNGLGRHDNDGMFSFYVASPAGFLVEVGHGARVITEGWDDNRRYDRASIWGHQPLRPGATR
jgi:2,3-dihydroxybiphenyl 1,2-dioxygenase